MAHQSVYADVCACMADVRARTSTQESSSGDLAHGIGARGVLVVITNMLLVVMTKMLLVVITNMLLVVITNVLL